METRGECELFLQFSSPEPIDVSGLDHLARRLNKEFLQANVASSLPAVASPPGTRSGLEVAAGAVLVKAAPELIPAIIRKVIEFISRSPDHSIEAKVQLGDRSVEVKYATRNVPSEQDITSLVNKLRGTIAD